QQLVVQQAVRRGRVAAVRARPAVETGEAAARLGHDDRGGGHVPERQLRLRAQVDRPLGDHHVRPEVAVRPGAPHLPGQVEEAVQAPLLLPAAERGVGEGGVGELRDLGDVEPGGRGQAASGEGTVVQRGPPAAAQRSEEHTSELQSRENLVCRLLLEKKKTKNLKRTNADLREIAGNAITPLALREESRTAQDREKLNEARCGYGCIVCRLAEWRTCVS